MKSAYTAFDGNNLLASGTLQTVLKQALARLKAEPMASLLLFDDSNGRQTDIDLGASVTANVERILQPPTPANTANRGKGRPRLGVVSKEVTLLPRHWSWLRAQQGGASAALRRLVDEARRVQSSGDQVQQAQNATYAFSAALAGNLPGFEEATRALFAKDQASFTEHVKIWPVAIRDYAQRLAAPAFVARSRCLETAS